MGDYDLTATGGRMLAAEPCGKCGSSGHLASCCTRQDERVLPDGTVVDQLGNFVGIDQPAAKGKG
jgi:hypothetical protein